MIFVILHYKVIEETIKCIESIKKSLKEDDYRLIVVDNGSKNGTGKELENIFKKDRNIEVLINEENLGFSKGNNVGCNYAISKYNPKFLIVINSDTYIDDSKILEKIKTCYETKRFDVLGPNIWNTRFNYNQNPYETISSIEEIDQMLKQEKKDLKAIKNNYFLFIALYRKIKGLLKKKKEVKINSPNKMGLNGAALIFSKDYIKKYKEIFIEDPFIYSEEHFLNFRRIKDNLVFAYDFNIKIYHSESITTNKIYKNKMKKLKFQIQNQYESKLKLRKRYEEYLKGDKNER